MQKVYLLLRNNQQTGPHSLEELIQLGLKPFDLIWVEGKSYGWAYPSEVETLKSFFPATSVSPKTDASAIPSAAPPSAPVTNIKAPGKTVFVRMPASAVPAAVPLPSLTSESLEQKAEELRKRAQAYIPQGHGQNEDITTRYARHLSDVEEDYTSWLYQSKAKKKSPVHKTPWMIAGFIAVAAMGGWWAIHTPAAKKASTTPLVLQSDTKEPLPVTAAERTELPVDAPAKKSKPVKQAAMNNPGRKAAVKKAVAATAAPITIPTQTAPGVVQKEPVAPPEQNTVSANSNETSAPAATQAPKEKKKTLKQILGGLFKKDKKEEPVQQEPQPANNSNNQRTATHRGEEVAGTVVDLADQVEVKSNKSTDDWMMGVQGLKLTLYNRSAATVKNASVEVLYYSEQNSLLQKKTVYFSNIAPQRSQTVAAPDHRLADHVEYKVTEATGVED